MVAPRRDEHGFQVVEGEFDLVRERLGYGPVGSLAHLSGREDPTAGTQGRVEEPLLGRIVVGCDDVDVHVVGPCVRAALGCRAPRLTVSRRTPDILHSDRAQISRRRTIASTGEGE